MLASTSAKLLTQPSKRYFCSCTPRSIPQLPGVGKEPTYTPPSAKKPRKNASPSPRKKAGLVTPESGLFAAVAGKTAINHRPTLINQDSCRDLVRAWGIDKMHDVVVLEPYAGKHITTDEPRLGGRVLISNLLFRTWWVNPRVARVTKCQEGNRSRGSSQVYPITQSKIHHNNRELLIEDWSVS